MVASQVVQQPEESNEGKLNHLVAAQLCKTKMCAMFAKGTCRDSKCRFAHSASEMRSPIDLTKTAMCRKFAQGKCKNPTCKFAHGEAELRVTESVYKTQLCNFHQRGHCKKGNRCRHAHGDHELRSFPDAPVLPFDMNAVESPDETGDVHSLPSQKIDHPVSEDLVMPAAESSQVLSLEQILALAMQSKDTTSGLRSNEGTPPHSNLSRNHWQQTTPEKVVPMFPGIQRNHSSMTCAPPAVPQCSPQVAEPMDLSFKVDRLPSSAGLISSQIALAARMAKAAELELQAAQIKAQQQIQYAAEIAAGAAQCNSLLGGRTAIDDAIMQTLHQRIPLRDIAPMNIDTAAPVLPPGLACQVAPPGLGASRQISPKDFLFRHTADMSNQRNTAWVI
mmetsp:Transcript_85911/g.135640  ORF Transcript_85911/g.135640 Transcript_85911/m.135640 type:complete len:391 (-) Transcript_85911:171-1343(-)